MKKCVVSDASDHIKDDKTTSPSQRTNVNCRCLEGACMNFAALFTYVYLCVSLQSNACLLM